VFHSCWWIPILSTPEIVFYFQESQGPCASNSPSTAITLSRNGQGIDRQDIDDATRGGGLSLAASIHMRAGRQGPGPVRAADADAGVRHRQATAPLQGRRLQGGR